MYIPQRGPSQRTPEKTAAEVNRKLIRPSLTDLKEQIASRPPRKKPTPPEQTNAENFYYVKQMQARTPVVVVLQDGENIHGVIEWYDKYCIKVNRISEPNLLIYKSNIKYLYKENEVKGSAKPPEQSNLS